MQYYGTRLSENISRREPEGYLLCLNVPVARTGTQEYLPEELGLPRAGAGPGGTVAVYRPEEEVFAPETLASFEGMPVTNDHPPDGVDIENIRRLQTGHAHNVRRGSGEESDLLLADLIITDPRLADAILAGKREISCGYTYELCFENGRYIQRRIRGNHIAVVDAGRAGSRVSIRDNQYTQPQQPERRKTPMKKSVSKLLARMAKDGDVETVAEFIEEMISNETRETPGAAEPGAEPAAVSVPADEPAPEAEQDSEAPASGEDPLLMILQKLDRLISLLTPVPAADEGETLSEVIGEVLGPAAEGEAPVLPPEEIAEIVGEVLDPEDSPADPAADEEEERAKENACAADTARAVLLAVRPHLAKLPARDRRIACSDISARLAGRTPASDRGVYAALASARRAEKEDPAELGRRIMAKRNPNYHG